MAHSNAAEEPIKPEAIGATFRQIPIEQFSADDVFIVAYPKSGSTWFQNLSAGILFGIDPDSAPDTQIQRLVPDVHYKRFYERLLTPMAFKSHALPRPDYRRVVYLLRDGRDVAVSHLHHRAALFPETVTTVQLLQSVHSDAQHWKEHVEAWQINPHAAKMITIKYEDLLRDAAAELRRFCDFLALARSDQVLQHVARQASFSRMQEKELRTGWDNLAWPKDKAFIRRGIAGSYRDELPPHLLEAFLQAGAETLRTCGYR